MLGWNIEVWAQGNDGKTPAASDSAKAGRLLDWRRGNVRLLDDLVKEGKAVELGGNGYPLRYTARAGDLFLRITTAYPDVVGPAQLAACDPHVWLLIEAWDLS